MGSLKAVNNFSVWQIALHCLALEKGKPAGGAVTKILERKTILGAKPEGRRFDS
jgi:hypothetical protein